VAGSVSSGEALGSRKKMILLRAQKQCAAVFKKEKEKEKKIF
jgi:hypothetical protein